MSSEEYSEMVASLKEMVELMKNMGVSEEAAKKRAEAVNEERIKELEILEKYDELGEITLEQEREKLRLRKILVPLTADQVIEEERALKAKEETLKVQKEYNDAIKTMADEFDLVFSTVSGISDKWQKTTLGKLFQPGGFEALSKSFKKTFTVSNALGSSLMAMQEATLDLALAQDSALAEFNKNTGAARLYGDQLIQLESDMYRFGVSMDDAAQVGGSLVNNMKGFNTLSGPQQKNLMETTAILNELGVNSDITAGNIETMTRIMGLNTDQAAAQSREMFTLAQSLGMPPAEMAEAFKAASPQMAKFGSEGTEVFKKLAVNARAAGMEVDQILSIVEKFDTFEGAADSVGKLNAMLGGPFLNSLEMVKATDPTERMKMLSDAVNQSGQSFDEMGYYQRIALTEAMGLKDVSELALVMAGEFDNMAGSASKNQSELVDLAKQQQEFNDIAEEAKQLMRMFAISMRPVITFLKNMMQGIQDLNAAMGGWLPAVATASLALFTLAKRTRLATIADTTYTMVTKALGIETDKKNKAMKEGQKTSAASAKTMMAFGFSILMIGAGIGLAALGVSQLALAFSNLNGAQIVGATIAIGLFGAAMVGIIVALGTLTAGPQAALVIGAIAIMLAFAAAAVIMGAAVNLAASGVALLFGSIVNLFANVSVAQLFGLGASMMILSYAMYALAGSVFALPMLSMAMFGLGKALSQIDASSLAPVAALFISIDSILSKNIENLDKTEKAITKIAESINSIDNLEKTIAVKEIIEAVQGAASRSRVATVSASAGGAAAAGGGTLVPNGTPFTVHVDLAGRTIDTYMLKFLNGKLGGL